MPSTCENWHRLVNSYVYYAQQIHEIFPGTVDFKAPRSFKIHWARQYLVYVALFGLKDM